MRLIRSALMMCLSILMLVMLTACQPETSPPPEQDPGSQPEQDTNAADSDLEAILEAPSTVQYEDDNPVMVRFMLVNRSGESLYVLKWYTPLEGIGGEIFAVERDGEPLPYEGILAYRANPTPDSYVHLEAGESVSAEVDLSSSYDLSQPGLYTIEFLSPRISHITRSEGQMATTMNELGPVTIPSNTVEIRITAPAG